MHKLSNTIWRHSKYKETLSPRWLQKWRHFPLIILTMQTSYEIGLSNNKKRMKRPSRNGNCSINITIRLNLKQCSHSAFAINKISCPIFCCAIYRIIADHMPHMHTNAYNSLDKLRSTVKIMCNFINCISIKHFSTWSLIIFIWKFRVLWKLFVYPYMNMFASSSMGIFLARFID